MHHFHIENCNNKNYCARYHFLQHILPATGCLKILKGNFPGKIPPKEFNEKQRWFLKYRYFETNLLEEASWKTSSKNAFFKKTSCKKPLSGNRRKVHLLERKLIGRRTFPGNSLVKETVGRNASLKQNLLGDGPFLETTSLKKP